MAGGNTGQASPSVGIAAAAVKTSDTDSASFDGSGGKDIAKKFADVEILRE